MTSDFSLGHIDWILFVMPMNKFPLDVWGEKKKKVVIMITISPRRGRCTVGVHRCSFTAHQKSLGKEKRRGRSVEC